MSSVKTDIKRIILLSCDTDFVPVMQYLREEFESEIILDYYADRKGGSRFSMSNHMLTACDKAIKLEKKQLEKAIIEK